MGQNIVNIDISNVVIKAMQEKYRDKPGMSYSQMDARAMEAADGSYNVVIDKATIDSILCGEGSTHNAQKMLQEISRVLQPNGVYVAVSRGQPSYRLTYLQRPEFGWNVKIYTVQKPMMGMSASLAWHARRWHHGRHARWSNRKPWRHSTQSRS